MNAESVKKTTLTVSGISIAGNIILTGFKLIAGIIGHSRAMLADAMHSMSDIAGGLVVIAGAYVSGRKSDDHHPYGHEKMECIVSIILGNILILVAIGIGADSISLLLDPSAIEEPGLIALIAACVSIVGKELMYRYTIYHAKKINSVSLRAEALHHRSDVYSSIGSFAGILAARLGIPALDPVAGLVICFFILKAAYDIFRESIDRLVDRSCDAETTQKMLELLEGQSGVISVDDIKTRLFGSRVYVDIEIMVERSLSLLNAHEIAEACHASIERSFPEVKHCTVHVNPCPDSALP